MKEENVIILVHKRLLGTIDAAEGVNLSQWIEESPERLDFVEKTELAWQLSQSKVSSFQPDMEKALNRFKTRLEEDKREERKVVPMNTRRRWMQVVAVAAALAGVFMVWNNSQDNSDWNTLATLDGEQKEIQLMDGTQIWLNENSSISYPNEFGDLRQVKLEGEAFFDVAKDPEHPFSISTNAAKVNVLGTSFNVRSYDEEQKVIVAVQSGKVGFSPNKSSQRWELVAKEKITFDVAKKTYQESVDETANDWSWHSQQLQFKNTKLKEVLSALERHYDLKIKLTNKALYNCRNYTGTFNNARVEDILASLEVVFKFKAKPLGNQSYELTGGSCQ